MNSRLRCKVFLRNNCNPLIVEDLKYMKWKTNGSKLTSLEWLHHEDATTFSSFIDLTEIVAITTEEM